MINLLPKENKKRVKKEYSKRVWVISLFASFSTLTIILALLVGTHIASSSKEKVVLAELDALMSSEEYREFSQIEEDIDDINMKISFIKDKREYLISDIILSIAEMSPASIEINQIFYDRKDDQDNDEVEIKGMAETREALLAFDESLKEIEFFLETDMPISSLIKERDLTFRIKIVVPKPF